MNHLLKAAFCVLTLQVFLGLAGCAKGDSSSSSAPAATTQCQAGYAYSSQYGCLAQGACQTGYAMFNNQCTYLGSTSTTTTPGGGYYGNMCSAGLVWNGNSCVASNSATFGTCQGSCQPGQVQTQYGCYPQNACSPCYGNYGKYCMGGSPVGYMTYMLQ